MWSCCERKGVLPARSERLFCFSAPLSACVCREAFAFFSQDCEGGFMWKNVLASSALS